MEPAVTALIGTVVGAVLTQIGNVVATRAKITSDSADKQRGTIASALASADAYEHASRLLAIEIEGSRSQLGDVQSIEALLSRLYTARNDARSKFVDDLARVELSCHHAVYDAFKELKDALFEYSGRVEISIDDFISGRANTVVEVPIEAIDVARRRVLRNGRAKVR